MRYRWFLVAILATFASAPLMAQNTYGPQPTFTFGGTGIPNDHVVTNSNAGSLQVLLGLAASQRCGPVDCNPPLTNDGANKFFALSGTDGNPPSPGNPYATWNFDFYVGGANVANYSYLLKYDFNPVVGNSDFGALFIAPVPDQDSWNLGMDFLSPPPFIPGLVFPPAFGPFDPNVSGEYEFTFEAINPVTQSIAASINEYVEVGSPNSTVPEPGTMSMLAVGLVGMTFVGKRRRKNQV